MKLEAAIERCFNRCNLDNDGDSVEIYKYMYQYKAIRELPDTEFEKVFDSISERLGFRR